MKNTFVVSVLIVLILSLLGCQGKVLSKGVVVDAITGQPIDSVLIELEPSEISFVYTDSLGAYEMWSGTKLCAPNCTRMNLKFSKEGYQTTTIINASATNVVELQPE